MAHQRALSLLDLPDKALLTVLRCLALQSLCRAARAHSALHQLSAAALSSISLEASQQQVASLQQYLSRQSAHVQSLELCGPIIERGLRGCDPNINILLDELPPGLQLQRLSLLYLRLQLLPGGGRAGVLQAGAPLKRLAIRGCEVSDLSCATALEQALSQLPQLERISYVSYGSGAPPFPGRALSHLQQLTSLEVQDAEGDVLEHIDLVPGLLDLRAGVRGESKTRISSTKLSALTSLVLSATTFPCDELIDTAGFANKSHLQHLDLELDRERGAAGVSALLAQLPHLTQLTHLSLQRCWGDLAAPYDGLPAAAYAALTASDTLQHLKVTCDSMPEGVWQHMLPADRQLPQLRVLNTSYCGGHGQWTHADTARLASCCSNLQELSMRQPLRSAKAMAADVLQPLRSLAALTALEAGELDDAGFAAAAGLTQLRQLRLHPRKRKATDVGLLQLTQLTPLTQLSLQKPNLRDVDVYRMWDEPVWWQVLQHCMKSRQPGVAELAQQAAASVDRPECVSSDEFW